MDGTPAPMADIGWSCDKYQMFGTKQADMQGRFTIRGLPPDCAIGLSGMGDKRAYESRDNIVVGVDEESADVVLVPKEE